jgi:hypothetical protein
MTFLPLSAISPDAEAVQEKYLATVRARLETDEYPPGLRKQYRLQLEHIKAKVPCHEVVLFQSVGFLIRKPDSFSLIRISSPLTIAAPDPKRKYVSFLPMMNQPFSRGTIVRVSAARHGK